MFVELMDLQVHTYIQSYGEVEAVELMQTLNASRSFIENLQTAVRREEVPSAKTIEGIIRSASYKMLLAKRRKVFFGSIFFLKALYANFQNDGIYIDELRFGQRLIQVHDMFIE